MRRGTGGPPSQSSCAGYDSMSGDLPRNGGADEEEVMGGRLPIHDKRNTGRSARAKKHDFFARAEWTPRNCQKFSAPTPLLGTECSEFSAKPVGAASSSRADCRDFPATTTSIGQLPRPGPPWSIKRFAPSRSDYSLKSGAIISDLGGRACPPYPPTWRHRSKTCQLPGGRRGGAFDEKTRSTRPKQRRPCPVLGTATRVAP